MTQDELAKKLNYKSRSSINKIELGQQNLGQRKIMLIAEALNTTPSYIMGWDENLDKNNAEFIPELLSDDIFFKHIKKLKQLNKEHQQTIFDNIDYWYEKEGH